MRFPRATRLAVFAKSQRAAERIMTSVTCYLTGTLHLVVNQEKSRVVTSEEFEFLSFAFVKSRATINVAMKSIRKFKQRIREITGRSGAFRWSVAWQSCDDMFAAGWVTSVWRPS